MTQAEPSAQELILRRTRAGFVGREAERAAFLGNFDIPSGDPRHRFRFHVHGSAGIGKTSLVQELAHLARERGALTAHVDDSVGSVPEAMEALCRELSAQGRRLKDLERRLATWRERRREAEAATLAAFAPDAAMETASTGSRMAVDVGLGALEAALPGAQLVTRALPADRLAQGADRLRAGLGARFRNPDDVDLVLTPERVLTPVLLGELRSAAAAVPWIVLFFDTYERTGPFLDPWLYDVLTKPREHGRLPAAVVAVTAGQRPLDASRWGGLDAVAEMPLAPFTEAEARRLLAARGVVAEPVVEEVLRLTGGLPVLVSTLAAKRPDGPDNVIDPSATAVERFLKPEPEARRKVARACALPRKLDADVFRLLVPAPDDELDALYTWLTALPFVVQRGERLQYHDLVRAQMLRLERLRSRTDWTSRHRRLAQAYAEWREDSEFGRRHEELWVDEEWWELRLEEVYHLLCARPPAALAEALRGLVTACREDEVVARRWARMLEEAGDAADHAVLREWGRSLGAALADEENGVSAALDLLLTRPGLDPPGRAEAHALRGRELRRHQEYAQALQEYDRAVELDPQQPLAHYGRGLTHQLQDDYPAALAALDRAVELAPDAAWIITERAETYRLASRFEEADADYTRALALDPTDDIALAGRAACRHALGRLDESLADFDRALSIDPEYLWALVRRARLHRTRGDLDKAFADLDRAAELAPDRAWVASERGDAYRIEGRYEEAVVELARAVELEPGYASALASRGQVLGELGRWQEASADLDRALALIPDYAWALVMRSRVKRGLGDREGVFEDLRRAVAAEPETYWIQAELASAYRFEGRYDEALPLFHAVLAQDPAHAVSLAGLGAIHYARKSYGQALEHLDRALASDPEYAWAYGRRGRVCLAIGRTEQALADLDRCVALDPEMTDEGETAIGLLLLSERWEEAEERLAASPLPELDDTGVEVHRHHGRWAQARALAERLREREPVVGTFQLALTVHCAEGPEAAEPLWQDLARLVEQDADMEPVMRAQAHCFLGCALADDPRADRGLSELLALAPEWDDLATLARILAELLAAPGADRSSRLTTCLTAVTEARDALQERWSAGS
ncbi:tetratricopeptide repeat protein [Streptomyces sp. SAI-041]|uniref:tetratricopeptide repeat protein n=1 Tax=Streptomyces sp. SAI-041 TaxID=2940548 RepID=UPI0024736060|nr:tetratricopeptide repeat protein [Streptomyces sp. SAI-041]MDH6550629.1 tetratricopeptide (TPR) repeat protein [Streptomyces sp. SAI-041]